jgi:hypothetical protein
VCIIIGIPCLVTGCDPNIPLCPLYNSKTGNLTAITSTTCNCNDGSCEQCQALTFLYDTNHACVATVDSFQSAIASSGSYTIYGLYQIWVNKYTGSCVYTSPTSMKATAIVGIVFLCMAGLILLIAILFGLIIPNICDIYTRRNAHHEQSKEFY